MAESYVVEVLFQKLIAWIEYFTGIINFPSFDESKAFHGKTLFVQSTKSNYISPEDEPEIIDIPDDPPEPAGSSMFLPSSSSTSGMSLKDMRFRSLWLKKIFIFHEFWN